MAEGQRVDRWLVLVTLTLLAAGLLMVLSSSQALGYLEYSSPFYFFYRQIVWTVLAVIALATCTRIDYHFWQRHALGLSTLMLLALLLVLVPHIGYEAYGARRRFRVGPELLQPAELAKLVFAILMSAWAVKRGSRIRQFRQGVVPFLALSALLLGPVVLEKDLGSTVILGVILVSIFFAAGARVRHLAILALLFGAAFALLVLAEPYRVARLETFLHPFANPLSTGFQSTQSLLALGSGGPFGVGLGNSVQKFQWLPEAQTDFIFAIIGEETGLIGTTFVMVLFCGLALRGYRAALRSPDRFGSLLAVGITSGIMSQALFNMGAVTATTPITGVPLPLISYGGTSLVATMAAIGVLLNISRQGVSRGVAEESDALVDIGRGNRRTRLSRPRSRASVLR